MKRLLQILSLIGLLLTFVPSILVFNDIITMQMHFRLMALGMVLWFGTSPFWMKNKKLENEEQ